MAEATCRSCGRPIVWARTVKGRRMPLDREPSEDGNLELVDGVARIVQRSMWGSRAPRYTSHFATCPTAAQHRRR